MAATVDGKIELIIQVAQPQNDVLPVPSHDAAGGPEEAVVRPTIAQQVDAHEAFLMKNKTDERTYKKYMLALNVVLFCLKFLFLCTLSQLLAYQDYDHSDISAPTFTPAQAPTPISHEWACSLDQGLLALCSIGWTLIIALFEFAGLGVRIAHEDLRLLPIFSWSRICYLGWPAIDDIPQKWFSGSSSMWLSAVIALFNHGCCWYMFFTVAPPMLYLVPLILSVLGLANKCTDLIEEDLIVVKCFNNGTYVANTTRVRGRLQIVCPNCKFAGCCPTNVSSPALAK